MSVVEQGLNQWREFQKKSMDRFELLKHPDRRPRSKDENFRHTRVNHLDLDRENLMATPDDRLLKAENQKGLFLGSLKEFGQRYPSESEKVFDRITDESVSFRDDLFVEMARAKTDRPLILYVEKGVAIADTVSVLQTFHSKSPFFSEHLFVYLSDGAQLRLTQEWEGDGYLNGRSPLHTGLTQCWLGQGASLELVQVQNFGCTVESFYRTIVTAEKDATFKGTTVMVGAHRQQHRFELQCHGEGSLVELHGLSKGVGSQHHDSWVRASHPASRSQSGTFFRSLVSEKSTSVFNGNIFIPKESVQVEAHQKSTNLLLSDSAVVHTLPKLEIAADDVQCSHGASVSPLNEDQIYYMQTRGIDREQAEEMMVQAHSEPILKRITDSSLQDKVRKYLVGNENRESQ